MAKVKDEGHEETEVVLASIEKKITKEYAQAEKEVSEKLDEYLRKFAVKDNIKRQAWLDGKITKEEYEQWRLGQIAVGKRWEEMKDSLAQDYTNAAEIAKSITDSHMSEVYAINHNYGTFQVEKAAHVDTSYTLYDTNAVERLFKDNNKLYHDYGIKVGKSIKEGKQLAWDKKQIQSVMTQSLLQGESIGKIATRLSKAVGDTDRKACIRNARTMTTGVQNAGRVDSYKRAEDMGIDLMQEWLATLDSRTRHEHRMLDGQRVKVGEKFQVDGYELAFPADPEGEAFLVYNCRCTLVPVLKGFEVDSTDLSLRNTNHMEEETYEEWKESHNITSDSITKQDDIEKTMKREYNNEYRELQGKRPLFTDNDTTGYVEETFDRRIGKFNSDEEVKKVNPNYVAGRKSSYETNCQRCVPTFLLRKQGYDVIAAPSGYKTDSNAEFVMRRAGFNMYNLPDGTHPRPLDTMKSTTFGKKEIEDYMAKLDDGALCAVSCSWKKGSAHVFLAEKKDGAVRFIDPQTGETDVAYYFDMMKKQTTFYYRIDNTTINEDYLPYICTNKNG